MEMIKMSRETGKVTKDLLEIHDQVAEHQNLEIDTGKVIRWKRIRSKKLTEEEGCCQCGAPTKEVQHQQDLIYVKKVERFE